MKLFLTRLKNGKYYIHGQVQDCGHNSSHNVLAVQCGFDLSHQHTFQCKKCNANFDCCNIWQCSRLDSQKLLDFIIIFKNVNLVFSCDQAALWMVQSVCLSVRPSVCPSVCHTFLTMFPSSCHHEIFRSYYQSQKWRPCKRSRSEVKGQGHRGHNPT